MANALTAITRCLASGSTICRTAISDLAGEPAEICLFKIDLEKLEAGGKYEKAVYNTGTGFVVARINFAGGRQLYR